MSDLIRNSVTALVESGRPMTDCTSSRVTPMLRKFSVSHPGVTVDVVQGSSQHMLKMLDGGEVDIALTTCEHGTGTQEILRTERLVWAVLDGGCAVERTPLPVSAWDEGCFWRRNATERLDEIGRPWRLVFQSPHTTAQRAAVLADLAVAPISEQTLGGGVIEAPAKAGLPKLPSYDICLAMVPDAGPAVQTAAEQLRESFRRA